MVARLRTVSSRRYPWELGLCAQHTRTGASEKSLKIWQGVVSSAPGISVY
jgi:hypothetical protein